MPKKISLIGKESGKLKIIAEAPSRIVAGVPRIFYVCRCDCGKTVEIKAGALSESNPRRVKSCGCGIGESARERMTTHGHTVGGMSPTYNSWSHAKTRCFNPDYIQYKDYGGRGITMCNRWKESYPDFLEDLGERPKKHSIDRIDTNGNYSCGKCPQCVEHGWPMNCKWGTSKEQRRTARHNHIVNVGGFKGCFTDAAAHFGIDINTAAARYRYGWSYERIFLTPVRPCKTALG